MKYTVTMLALFLSVTSAWTGTLRDNFDDGDFEGWRQSKWGDQTAQWSVKKGEMVCMSQNVCGIGSLLRIGDNTWKDYEFVCQFKIEQTFPLGGCNTFRDPGACIAVHYDDDARQSIDGGVATVGGPVWNTFFFEKAVQENFTALQVGNFVTEGGKWHALRIVASGNNYQMFINNKLMSEQQIDLPDTGSAGLCARNCEVHFDVVVITGNGIPDKDLSLPVDPKAKLATRWATIKQRK